MGQAQDSYILIMGYPEVVVKGAPFHHQFHLIKDPSPYAKARARALSM